MSLPNLLFYTILVKNEDFRMPFFLDYYSFYYRDPNVLYWEDLINLLFNFYLKDIFFVFMFLPSDRPPYTTYIILLNKYLRNSYVLNQFTGILNYLLVCNSLIITIYS